MAESIAYNLFKEYTGPEGVEILSGLPNTDPKTFETTWLECKSGRAAEN